VFIVRLKSWPKTKPVVIRGRRPWLLLRGCFARRCRLRTEISQPARKIPISRTQALTVSIPRLRTEPEVKWESDSGGSDVRMSDRASLPFCISNSEHV
jgi:hypothetical protein